MASRKRGRAEMEAVEPTKAPSLLSQLRNMWEFANIMQFIFIFGKALKIDEDFDIEDLEDECMKPESSYKLAEIGLCLLKFISSQRGLTLEMFDEHTRRQYKRRLPEKNPFGDEEEPNRFVDFDIFTKLCVLCQLSQWVFVFTDRLREKMDEKESEQVNWRISETGWDSDERSYFILDDNRLYRRTDPAIPPPPPPPPPPKAKTKAKAKAKAKKPTPGTRSSKRRKTTEEDGENLEPQDDEDNIAVTNDVEAKSSDTYKWECIAVTLEDYHQFLDSIKKSRDANERNLHKTITTDVLPVIEKLEEDRQKKIARRQRELMNMEKMAHAKRSSRIAGKQEREQQEAEARAAEEKRKADLAAARKDAERQKHMEEARESRMMTREQRLKEREYKRLLHEEELKKLAEDSEKVDAGESRLSERHLKAEMAKRQKELKELEEEESWYFDCEKCGVHGDNIDDGTHSLACEKCNVWQHSACWGFSQDDAEKDDFHFLCDQCRAREVQREEDAKKPKIAPLKFKLNPSSSPPSDSIQLKTDKPETTPPTAKQESPSKKRKSSDLVTVPGMPPMKKWKPPQVFSVPQKANGVAPSTNGAGKDSSMHQAFMKGPTLTPHGQHGSHNGTNSAQNAPPPGLISPTRPTAQPNGARPNGGLAPAPKGIFSSAMQDLNGQPSTILKPSHPTLPAPTPNVGKRSPPPSTITDSPYGIHQTPASSQRSSFTTPTNGIAASPSQQPAYLNTPSTNLPPSSAATPSLQPGFSPQKPMLSSPPTAATYSTSLHGSSSPKIAPPPENPQAAGYSPLKHKPPRPASSQSNGTSNHIGETPILPPVQKLVPSPTQQPRMQPVLQTHTQSGNHGDA